MLQNEKERLAEVKRFLNLNYDKSSEFQDIVNLASQLCEKPIALITLLDEDLNWIKVRTGVDEEAAPRETSFCQFGIQQSELLIIHDATKDSRFDNNPLVQEQPGLRFYAGAPLVIGNGLRLGTLCLFDLKPNMLTPLQQQILKVLSRQVTFLMELQMGNHLLHMQVQEIQEQNEALRKISHIQSHDIRQPLTSIMGLINTIKEDNYVADKERLLMLEEAAMQLDERIHDIVAEAEVKQPIDISKVA